MDPMDEGAHGWSLERARGLSLATGFFLEIRWGGARRARLCWETGAARMARRLLLREEPEQELRALEHDALTIASTA